MFYTKNNYYLYYITSTIFTQESAIGLAKSPTMDPDTWTDHGEVVSSKNGSAYNCIDASLVQANDRYYLTFGSAWNDIYQAPSP